MSIILDALKKSESDRQGKNRPESAHIPTGSKESSPSRWLSIVGILLLVNVIVLLVIFLKPDPGVVEPAAVSTADESITAAAPSFRNLVANAKDRQGDAEPSDVVASDQPPTAAAVVQARPSVAAPADRPSTSTIAYKSFNEVRVNGSVQLPDLHLDLHVFNGKPADRFVFINMNKYGEHATMVEGPLVAEIVPEGVILEYAGARFLLPRE